MENKDKKLERLYRELVAGPIESLKNKDLMDRFNRPMEIILFSDSNISPGKSTLGNALLGREVFPMKNRLSTSIIFKYINTDREDYGVRAYDLLGVEIAKLNKVFNRSEDLYSYLTRLNEEIGLGQITIEGKIDFLQGLKLDLVLVDTPNLYLVDDRIHREIMERVMGRSNDLILFVIDILDLDKYRKSSILRNLSKYARSENNSLGNRIIFLINKMDLLDGEDMEGLIEDIRCLIIKNGIDSPKICPLSGLAGLKLKVYLEDHRGQGQSLEELFQNNSYEELGLVSKLNEAIHLELLGDYRDSNFDMEGILKEGLLVEKALIHSGLKSLEKEILDYYLQVFKPGRIKSSIDHLESFMDKRDIYASVFAELRNTEKHLSNLTSLNEDLVRRLEDLEAIKILNEELASYSLKFNEEISNILYGKVLEFNNWYSQILKTYTEDNMDMFVDDLRSSYKQLRLYRYFADIFNEDFKLNKREEFGAYLEIVHDSLDEFIDGIKINPDSASILGYRELTGAYNELYMDLKLDSDYRNLNLDFEIIVNEKLENIKELTRKSSLDRFGLNDLMPDELITSIDKCLGDIASIFNRELLRIIRNVRAHLLLLDELLIGNREVIQEDLDLLDKKLGELSDTQAGKYEKMKELGEREDYLKALKSRIDSLKE